MKRWPWLFAVVLAAMGLSGVLAVQVTDAAFTSHSASHLSITADQVQNWLHLYSQSTDPDGLSGYATRVPSGEPAATGLDETLVVDLGTTKPGNTTWNRVFTAATPRALPVGSEINVTVDVLPDPATGQQPVREIGFSPIGSGSSFTNPITMSAQTKVQLNLKVQPRDRGVTYRVTIRLTMTYPGFEGSYYQYFVPLAVARD